LLFFCIVFGTIFPFIIQDSMAYILTLSCINAFSLGGLIAYIEMYPSNFGNKLKKGIQLLSIPLLILLVLQFTFLYMQWFSIRFITGVITLQAIILCLQGAKDSIILKLFTNKLFNFIGSISYGIYLYHCPLPSYWRRFFRVLHIENPFVSVDSSINYYELLFQFMLFLIVSYLSWIMMEKPILKLKKYV
jgi:peptidoglycan/LPS O-acetylase OafA/YrhL